MERVLSLVAAALMAGFAEAGIVAAWTNACASWAVDSQGRIVSLRADGKELIAKPEPMVSARTGNGADVAATEVSGGRSSLVFKFPGGRGEATVSVEPFETGWTLKAVSLSVKDATAFTFCKFSPTCTKYLGGMANMYSDDEAGVCLRGYDLPVEMNIGGGRLWVGTTAEHGLAGFRAGLSAGRKAKMPALLQGMALAAGVPHSTLGGPWALGAEANRGSYLFAYLTKDSTEDWIDLALRGGFAMIHPDGWYSELGHYLVNKGAFPDGLEGLKESARRIHAAGLEIGAHTLTACISPTDSWVTPQCSPDLIPFKSYTLAAPLTADAKEFSVNEEPWDKHDVVFTYSGNGNAIRIDGEVIQYTAVKRDKPFGFTGCTRGAFGTKPAAHATGERADYLQQRYGAFYPQPDSKLADDLAGAIGSIFKTCGFDEIYFDGSEGMMTRYGIDVMRRKIFTAIGKQDLQTEASCHGQHSWWFHSLIGAWDHPVWAPKRFHDLHVASTKDVRKTDLLGPEMGWWAPRQATSIARGHFLDEMDYFACKNFALDSMMSIQGVSVAAGPLPSYIEKQMTVLGWYERLRLARAFDAETVARLEPPGKEFWLRQGEDGAWRFLPVTMQTHRVSKCGNGSEQWAVAAAEAGTARLRVEALYAAAPYDTKDAVPLLDASSVPAMKTQAANNVKISAAQEQDAEHGAVIALSASSATAAKRGAWACAELLFDGPAYKNISKAGAFGVWVKGDGKGELLNIQLRSPREYMGGVSEQYIDIDFTGWRYVELLARERDMERFSNYVWPYGGGYSYYRDALDFTHISGVSLFLNEIPANGSCAVAVSQIRALPIEAVTLDEPAVTVNGTAIALPFPLQSGEFAELDARGWTHYKASGDPIALAKAKALPQFKAGQNAVTFSAAAARSLSARAEVTFTTFGAPFGKMKAVPVEREYALPMWYSPANGANELDALLVRPGERARAELELCGAIDQPELAIGAARFKFPVALAATDRLQCRDGRNWRVINAQRRETAKGTLATALPALNGKTPVALTCSAPDKANAWLKFTKVYGK
jgi:hypothetical protein